MTDNPWQYTSSDQNSPGAHIATLHKFQCAIPLIVPKDPELVFPRLWHPDFHAGNIYVNGQGEISSIIDWQGAGMSPVFTGARLPLLLDYGLDMLMRLPENFKQLDDVAKDQLRYQVSQSILIHSYETTTADKNPLMHKMMRYPHSQTLKQLEAFAGSPWDSSLYPLQECVMRVEKEWEYFDSDLPCPYHYSLKEIRKHHERANSFNKSREFWDGLRDTVSDEGYTSNETFSKAIEIFRDLRESGLAVLEGEERMEFDKKTRWVLDLSA